MIPRRYRVLYWAAPAFALHWILIVAIGIAGSGTYEYVNIGLFFGSVFGQTTLAAAWAALGPGRIAWRIPLSLVWIAMLPVVMAITLAIHTGPDDGAVLIGACLLGQWMIVQLALWVLAIGCGLHLRHVDDWEKASDRHARQFSLRHLMVVTAIVGVVFGAGRILIPWLAESLGIEREAPVFIFLAVAAFILTLPLLLAGLLSRWAIPAVLLVLTLIGFATAWEMTLLRMLPGGSGPGPETGHFIGINIFTAATILAGVLLLRLNGYGTRASQKANE